MDSDDAESLLVDLGVGYYDINGLFQYGIAMDDSPAGQLNKAEVEAECDECWPQNPMVIHVSDGRTYVVNSGVARLADESSGPTPGCTCLDEGGVGSNCVFIAPSELDELLKDPFGS